MKRILKGLFVVVTSLGCIGLQAMQNITYIETTELNTEVLLVPYPEVGDIRQMENIYHSKVDGTTFLRVDNPAKEEIIPRKFPVSYSVSVINHNKKTGKVFTADEIQGFDPKNTSGEWTLKIEGERISFEKP